MNDMLAIINSIQIHSLEDVALRNLMKDLRLELNARGPSYAYFIPGLDELQEDFDGIHRLPEEERKKAHWYFLMQLSGMVYEYRAKVKRIAQRRAS
jgi:hypothetical protein